MYEGTRRSFLKCSMAGAAAIGLARLQGQESESLLGGPAIGDGIIDTHVGVFRWPFGRVKLDEPASLVAFLRGKGVAEAWAGSYEAIFAKDMSEANRVLADTCASASGFLRPFGTVNPRLPDWEEDLRRCHEEHSMRGLRLYPNYQAWTLGDERFGKLLELAARHSLLVQIVTWMEDERHHHPLMQVPNVDLRPLPEVVDQVPEARVQVLNGFRNPASSSLRPIFDHPRIFVDIAKMDVLDGLDRLLQEAPAEKILFGSHAPLFIWEATALKLRESVVKKEVEDAILRGNARRLLAAVA